MLNYKHTQLFDTVQRDVLPGAALVEDGIAAVYTREAPNGELTVKPSTGAANEIFAGFTLNNNIPGTFRPNVEEGIVTPVINLARVPVAGQILVKVDGTAVEVEAGSAAPSAATKITLTADGDLIPHADQIGKGFVTQYHYELTASELRSETGDTFGGVHNTASAQFGKTGLVIRADELSTNMFDASADWSAVINPSLGANGMLTVGGNGTVLKNVFVLAAPSGDNAFLKLEVRG